MNVNDLVGKRCLLKYLGGKGWGRSETIDEFRMLEVSPSGNWVKLMNLNGLKFWKAVADVALVETLIDLKAERAKETKE